MGAIERVAVVGADHWHAEIHISALQKAGKKIVGVSASRPGAAEAWASRLDCRAWSDYRQLVEDTRPEFVVAMARHVDLPAVGAFLIETGIPFVIEKPLGLNAGQVAPLAEAARRKNAFAAIPFVNRYSPIWQQLAVLKSARRLGHLAHAHFRIVNGPPVRYEKDGVSWMLDPAISGGGCLRNLGVHLVDAFLFLTGEEVEVVGAQVSSKLYGKAVEEYATAILRSRSGVLATIEAGYTFASMTEGDFEWRIAAANAYLVDRAGELSLSTLDEGPKRIATPPLEGRYDEFIADSLCRAEQGQPPLASIEDCLRAVQVIDRIYEQASVTRWRVTH